MLTSSLTQRSYQAAPCDLLLKVTPENLTEAVSELERTGAFGPYSGLSISGVSDLGFLARFPKLLYLEVRGQTPVDTGPLEGLGNLRGLHLETPGEGIDFEWLPLLEVYRGGWHAKHRNFRVSQELRSLRLRSFNPRSRDFEALAGMTRLETLEITQSNVESLAGLEGLEDLRYLSLAYATKLESLDELASWRARLRELAVRNAKKLRSYSPIAAQALLRRLRLTACAPMASLAWTAGMRNLDSFSFVDTDVLDGDLAPLLALPSLQYAGTLDKKHYSHKFDDLNAALQARRAAR